MDLIPNLTSCPVFRPRNHPRKTGWGFFKIWPWRLQIKTWWNRNSGHINF